MFQKSYPAILHDYFSDQKKGCAISHNPFSIQKEDCAILHNLKIDLRYRPFRPSE